ncbi:hypothetical protein [Synechocystis sp. PCC 7509]|uniref:hypothetical protein n=1 Tax=Synechocystis sp. PCC 7509 TaxID=927677 RepID=UPI0002ABF5C9|nr:hypothetical protein [Synechocystis sp. PCC 7509]
MYEVSQEKDIFPVRISPIIDTLFANNSFFQERLDKNDMSQHITNLFKKLSAEEFINIDNQDLKDRIDGMLVINATAGILNDLTSEELETFDAAVEGR